MSKNSREAMKNRSGALPLDVLESIVGGAGLEKKQDLNADRAVALTAGEPAQAQQAAAENKAALSKDDIKAIEKSFRSDPTSGAIKVAAGMQLGGIKAEGSLALEVRSWKDVSVKSDVSVKTVEKGTSYDKRDRDATAAKAAHDEAQAQTKAKTERLADATAKVDKSAKDWAAVNAAKADLDKAKARPQAASHDDGDSRDRSKSVGGKVSSSPDTVKWQEDRLDKARSAALKNPAAHEVLEKQAKNAAKAFDDAKEREAKAKAKADDLAARNSKAAVDAEKKQADRDALKIMAKNEGWSKGTSYAHDVQLQLAKEQAIKAGTHKKAETEEVLSGGVSTDVKTTQLGDKTVTDKVTSVGQTKIETVQESFSANGVSFGKSVQTWKGEIGKQHTTTTKDPNGATITHTDKAYGSLTGEKYGKYEISDVRKAVEVGAKLSVHGELSTTTKTKVGDTELTHTMAAVVDGSVGGKAGASIGIDGIKLNARVCAEITAKVCDIHEAKIGDLTIKNELAVYATAKAEAKAAAEVNFNPLAGEVKAKASIGAEASAGVGIQDTLSINKNLEVGGGAYIGKIGAKADVDVGVKDGKLNVSVDVGAALGVGVSVKFNAKVDIAGTASKAADEIKNGNILQKAGGVLSFMPSVFLIRGLFG